MTNPEPARKGVLLVISAPSGTGKSTLIQKLIERYPQFHYSISCTTRPLRANEKDGKHYFFLSEAEFLARQKQGYFAEWANVHGNYYGTPLEYVQKHCERGDDLLFDIDVQGALQLQKTLPQATFVFLFPPSFTELKNRLLLRQTETQASLQKRLHNAKNEIAQARFFEYHIINDDLKKAFASLEAIYLAQTVRQDRLLNNIATKLLAETE